jgi:hypothetical protein
LPATSIEGNEPTLEAVCCRRKDRGDDQVGGEGMTLCLSKRPLPAAVSCGGNSSPPKEDLPEKCSSSDTTDSASSSDASLSPKQFLLLCDPGSMELYLPAIFCCFSRQSSLELGSAPRLRECVEAASTTAGNRSRLRLSLASTIVRALNLLVFQAAVAEQSISMAGNEPRLLAEPGAREHSRLPTGGSESTLWTECWRLKDWPPGVEALGGGVGMASLPASSGPAGFGSVHLPSSNVYGFQPVECSSNSMLSQELGSE